VVYVDVSQKSHTSFPSVKILHHPSASETDHA